MGKYKENPMYNVISIRITDEEMATLVKMKQQTRKSTTMLLREAMRLYADFQAYAANLDGCLN